MRLFSAVLPANGEFRWTKGMQVQSSPFEHIAIGERTKNRKPCQIWVMPGLKKALSVKEMTPCPVEGKPESATLGVCRTCKVEVTAAGIFSVPDGMQKIGDKEVPLVKHLHKHNPIIKYDRAFRASFSRSAAKKTLLMVEEYKSDQSGKAAVLVYAEPPVRGASGIMLPPDACSDVMIDLIHGDAWGERWASPNGKMGVGMERIIILRPGQSFRIYREGELAGAPSHFLITLQRDFTLSARPMSDAEVLAMQDKADAADPTIAAREAEKAEEAEKEEAEKEEVEEAAPTTPELKELEEPMHHNPS